MEKHLLYEGDYTKAYLFDTKYEFDKIDEAASEGWVLITIIDNGEGKFIYIFQSKRKVYLNMQLQHYSHQK